MTSGRSWMFWATVSKNFKISLTTGTVDSLHFRSYLMFCKFWKIRNIFFSLNQFDNYVKYPQEIEFIVNRRFICRPLSQFQEDIEKPNIRFAARNQFSFSNASCLAVKRFNWSLKNLIRADLNCIDTTQNFYTKKFGFSWNLILFTYKTKMHLQFSRSVSDRYSEVIRNINFTWNYTREYVLKVYVKRLFSRSVIIKMCS